MHPAFVQHTHSALLRAFDVHDFDGVQPFSRGSVVFADVLFTFFFMIHGLGHRLGCYFLVGAHAPVVSLFRMTDVFPTVLFTGLSGRRL